MDALSKPPPVVAGIPIAFNTQEVEDFFVEVKRLPRGAGKKRKFSFLRLRKKLAEKVIRVILDRYHDGVDPRGAELLDFSMPREDRRHSGDYELRIEYRISGSPARWRQTFHFVLDNTSLAGGLNGKLYSSSRRSYAK